MVFEELKLRQAAAYSSAPFEQLADSAADIHDHVVDAIGVTEGEHWLDLATGTGAVAVRAARRGASVTGQDLASGLIETARRLAAAEGLDITFDVGDCEQLPYPDASFDVVSSAQGAVFAPDHAAVASETSRVCRAGGRLALTAWRPGGAMEAFFAVLPLSMISDIFINTPDLPATMSAIGWAFPLRHMSAVAVAASSGQDLAAAEAAFPGSDHAAAGPVAGDRAPRSGGDGRRHLRRPGGARGGGLGRP